MDAERAPGGWRALLHRDEELVAIKAGRASSLTFGSPSKPNAIIVERSDASEA